MFFYAENIFTINIYNIMTKYLLVNGGYLLLEYWIVRKGFFLNLHEISIDF